INAFNRNDVKVSSCYAFDVVAVPRDGVDMPPAVPVAGPQEPFAVIDPFGVSASQSPLVPVDVAPGHINPGFVPFGHDRASMAGGDVAKHHEVRILKSIELLNDHLG